MRWDAALPAIDLATLGLGVVFVVLAAIVRGYSGFGFSLLAITAMSLIMPPSAIVPSLYMLELAAGVHLLPGVWKDIHWRSIRPLLVGSLAGTPIGVWLLANIPAAPMQVALGPLMLLAVALLWQGYALKTMPGPAASVTTGAASGLLNGAYGIAGPPVILFYFSSPAGTVAGRASLIAYFIGTDVIGMPMLAYSGLVTWETFIRALFFLPAMLAGVWVGARSFKTADPATFRKIVLIVLAVLAVMTAGQGLAAIRR